MIVEAMDHTQALPEDAIAEILGRLPPRDLAASRCVRKAWHHVVDAHKLLLPHVLPHSVCGLFVRYIDYERPCFFARPSAQPTINGNLNFLPDYRDGFGEFVDHCNGLLLYCCDTALCVVNPATRRWDQLYCEYGNSDEHLMFDPIASPHYEVFSIPHVPKKVVLNSPSPDKSKQITKSGHLEQLSQPHGLAKLFSSPNDESTVEDIEDDFEDGSAESSPEQSMKEGDFPTSLASQPVERRGEQEDTNDLMEWPPSLWTLNVFSSRTRQWQNRSFVREGEAAGTVTSVRVDPREPISMGWGGPRCRYSAYWQGSLYVHCRGAFVVRLSLSDYKYQVIKAPVGTNKTKHALYLGKSKKGVYLATAHSSYQLRVWTLTESSEHINWVLKHRIDLEQWGNVWLRGLKGFDKTWTLPDDDDHYYYDNYYCYDDDDDDDDDDDYDDDNDEEEEEEEGEKEEDKENEEEVEDRENEEEVQEEVEDKENEEGKEKHEEEEENEEGKEKYEEVEVQVEVEEEEEEEEEENEGEKEEEEDDEEGGVTKDNNEMVTSEDCEWNSDDDNVLNIEDGYDTCLSNISFLGFHPYKEVVFLALSRFTGVAYHLNSSKIQYLGDLRPKDYYQSPTNGLYESFPYTPFMIGELLKHASETCRRN